MAQELQLVTLDFSGGANPDPPSFSPGLRVLENMVPVWGALRAVPAPGGSETSLLNDAGYGINIGVQTDLSGALVSLNDLQTDVRDYRADATALGTFTSTGPQWDTPTPVLALNNRVFIGSTEVTDATAHDPESGTLAYSLGTSVAPWSICQYGKEIICTNYASPVQSVNLGDIGTPSFKLADLITSVNKPKAKFVDAVGSHIVLANIKLDSVTGSLGLTGGAYPDGYHPQVVWWSGTDQIDKFSTTALVVNEDDPGVVNSDYQPLYDVPGEITFFAGFPDAGIILKQFGSHFMRLVGGGELFSFSTIELGYGCVSRRSAIKIGNDVYFLAQDGFRAIKGYAASQPIMPPSLRRELFDESFQGDFSADIPPTIYGVVHDTASNCVIWFYEGAVNGDVLGAVYSIETGDWSLLHDVALDNYFQYVSIPSPRFLGGIWMFSMEAGEFKYRTWADAASTASPSTLTTRAVTKVFSLVPGGSGPAVGTRRTNIVKVRPVFRALETSTSAHCIPAITIRSAGDAQMRHDLQERTMNPGSGFAVDDRGWYGVPGGKISGEHFEVELVFPAATGSALYEIVGLQIQYAVSGGS